MRSKRTVAVASLTALALLAGCGGDDTSSTTPTSGGAGVTTSSSVAPTTATTSSPEALMTSLLQPDDVPGATATKPEQQDADLSACFPGNPIGAKTDPSEVDSPEFNLIEGEVRRNYSSTTRVATPEQVKAFVTTFGSASGSGCVLTAIKAVLGAPPNPVDVSGLTGSASPAAVADGGAQLAITGDVVAGGKTIPLTVDVLVFQKGSAVVFLYVAALGGPPLPGQTLELARKIAGRLP